MSAAPSEPEIVEDKEQSRYEVRLDGETIAVADHIGAHREYVDLVPADRRAEFGLAEQE